jgi:hypothetical protein
MNTSEHTITTEAVPSHRRRRTGTIACLPHELRERINQMLRDGVPYRVIIENLNQHGAAPLPDHITEHHISEWKKGGYKDWLDDQFWREEMRARHGSFSGLLGDADKIQLPEGGLQLAAIGLCELLRDVSRAVEDKKAADPDKYIRLANSLARVSRSILGLQQYRDACSRARAAIQQLKDPNRKLTDQETRALVRRVDSILGLQSMDDSEGHAPASPYHDNGTTEETTKLE